MVKINITGICVAALLALYLTLDVAVAEVVTKVFCMVTGGLFITRALLVLTSRMVGCEMVYKFIPALDIPKGTSALIPFIYGVVFFSGLIWMMPLRSVLYNMVMSML